MNPVDRSCLIAAGAKFGKTDIAWASATINPSVGCTKVSRACKNCYAIRTTNRGMHDNHKGVAEVRGGKYLWTGKVNLDPAMMTKYARVKAPMFIFGPSLSDTFHEQIPDQHVLDFLEACRNQPQHIFLWLTKRPERAAKISKAVEWPDNVWLGATIEEDKEVYRANALRDARVKTRFISAEPLAVDEMPNLDLSGIDWLIAGGESGPGAEPMKIDWLRSLRDRCVGAGVAFFFKQWGAFGPDGAKRKKGDSNTMLDGREWMEFPAEALAHVRRVVGTEGEETPGEIEADISDELKEELDSVTGFLAGVFLYDEPNARKLLGELQSVINRFGQRDCYEEFSDARG